MQVARKHFVNKTAALSSVAKNASCSRGWVRLMVQCIFAVITTTSFILIVLMAVTSPALNPKPDTVYSRCTPNNCRVDCVEAPYFGQWENEIFDAVAIAESQCSRVILFIKNASFENSTLPINWLAKLRSNIHELWISGGNLQHLPAGAFMSQLTVHTKTLSLHSLNIKTFDANSLVGLSRLETLNIVNCEIDGFQTNSLQAVDDTLQTLTISKSGFWDPVNVTGWTGFEKLTLVDFSYSDFNNVLGKDSFTGLKLCKILYLNSCGIISIGLGAFDHLSSIEVLYLNNNLLTSVPSGLFANIILIENPRPRISLQDNMWYCDCGADDLNQLVRKEILLVDAICMYPATMYGKTLTEFEKICANETEDIVDEKLIDGNGSQKTVLQNSLNDINDIFINGTCQYNNTSKSYNKMIFRLVSPQENSRCTLNRTRGVDVSLLTNNIINSINYSNWLNFSFYFKTNKSSAIYLGTKKNKDFGLLWFHTDCPNDLYCVDSMPSLLRIYNVDEKSQYTFCPMRLSSGNIESKECIGYLMNDSETTDKSKLHIMIIYVTTVLCCFCFGAIIVYGLICINPTLLKGSKRILFVKHKTVDALVLPPKIPLRSDLINNTALDFRDKDIFTVSINDTLHPPKMNRIKSIRSNKSNSPSYVSALQPSEDQLAEWRISHHFNNDLTISSKSELATLSWIYSDTSYYSLDESDRTYESLK